MTKPHDEYQENLNYLMGLKLNKFVSPRSQQEYNKVVNMGKQWFKDHPNDIINIY